MPGKAHGGSEMILMGQESGGLGFLQFCKLSAEKINSFFRQGEFIADQEAFKLPAAQHDRVDAAENQAQVVYTVFIDPHGRGSFKGRRLG